MEINVEYLSKIYTQKSAWESTFFFKHFPHTGPKVPHSRPAQKRECGIFGLGVKKNNICFMSHLVFGSLAFGSGGNLTEL